jgi:hypothetical protein
VRLFGIGMFNGSLISGAGLFATLCPQPQSRLEAPLDLHRRNPLFNARLARSAWLRKGVHTESTDRPFPKPASP